MKICLVGPGTVIPPKAWGAIEIIVWQYYNELKNLDGVIAYSMFQLPEDDNERLKILKKIRNQFRHF